MPLKRVVTISDDRLPVLSADLLSLMRREGFEPDVILGIATGGAKVVEAMGATGLPSFTCRLRRPTTATKERAPGKRVVTRVPYAVLDLLRIAEDWMGSRKPLVPAEATAVLRDELAELDTFVRASGARRVAVVDDALDSGATLDCVMRTLKEIVPAQVEIRAAVVTQTRPARARLICADFSLYDLVLLRFPWSLDFKGAA